MSYGFGMGLSCFSRIPLNRRGSATYNVVTIKNGVGLMGTVVRRAFLLAAGLFCGGCIFAGMLRLPVYYGGVGTVAAFSYEQRIELPVAVEGTGLVAEFTVLYEGPFVEDGSDRPVVNIASLMLRNVGETPIDSAEVILERGALRLTFQAQTIPPGAAVLVLEKDGKACTESTFTACYGWARQAGEQPLLDSRVSLAEEGMGTLLVTNLTDRALTDIRIFHKTYHREGDFYVGGVTYETRLDSLESGKTQSVYPYHYAAGYSKVVGIVVGGEM